jgi:hypothetical protein
LEQLRFWKVEAIAERLGLCEAHIYFFVEMRVQFDIVSGLCAIQKVQELGWSTEFPESRPKKRFFNLPGS